MCRRYLVQANQVRMPFGTVGTGGTHRLPSINWHECQSGMHRCRAIHSLTANESHMTQSGNKDSLPTGLRCHGDILCFKKKSASQTMERSFGAFISSKEHSFALPRGRAWRPFIDSCAVPRTGHTLSDTSFHEPLDLLQRRIVTATQN
jgi:hypothetical protein